MANQRITDNDLDALAHRLNVLTKSPTICYAFDEAPQRNVAQVGNFHISHAYGGVCLHSMSNTSGGVTTPLPSIHGHVPKRQLYDAMRSYLAGFELTQA